MSVSRLQLRNFTAFEAIDLTFCPGINVFLGENSTGKTHCLKALYVALKDGPQITEKVGDMSVTKGVGLLPAVFRPRDNNSFRLVRLGAHERHPVDAVITAETDQFRFQHRIDDSSIATRTAEGATPPDPVFIPSRDVLAMYEGFIAAYQKRELSFDLTFFDLCVALSASPLRKVPDVVERIDHLVGGRFEEQGGHFVLRSSLWEGDEIEAHMVAEGLRKLGMLGRLILNGSIVPGSVLLWDEPEAGLNPKLVTRLADVLLELARWGVQVFLTTHDYLLARHLSLLIEYRQATPQEIGFHGFFRETPGSPVQVERGEDLASLEHNALLEEFTRQYDFEQRLFQQAARGKQG
jgi:hypothetical protein